MNWRDEPGTYNPLRNKKLTDQERARCVYLYTHGMTIRRIMKEINRSYGGVYRALELAQVPMRARGKESNVTIDDVTPQLKRSVDAATFDGFSD